MLGAGYVGGEVAAQALARGDEVVLADNWYATERAQLDGLGRGAGRDRRHPRPRGAVDRCSREGLDRVVFLAAQASRPLSVAEPDYTEETNLTGTRRVAELVAAGGLALAFGSSLHVYGGGPRLSGEIGADHPYGAAGRSRAPVQDLRRAVPRPVRRRAGFELAILRLGIVYGPSPVEHDRPESQTVVDKFRRLAAAGERAHGRRPRPATIGVVHVEDAARILLDAPRDAVAQRRRGDA